MQTRMRGPPCALAEIDDIMLFVQIKESVLQPKTFYYENVIKVLSKRPKFPFSTNLYP